MSFLRKSLHIASKQLAYLIIILTVLLMMATGIFYMLSKAVEQRQDEISRWVSEQIHYPVTIGHAAIKWQHSVPKLYVSNIRLQNKAQNMTIASLDSLYFGLDIIETILKKEPVLSNITLEGLQIAIERTLSGQLGIQGVNSGQHRSEIDLGWLAILDQMQLYAVDIDYQDALQPQLSGRYQISHSRLFHNKSHWRIEAELALPQHLGQQLQLQGEVIYDDRNRMNSRWQGQISAMQINMPAVSQSVIWPDILLDQGWATFNIHFAGKGTAIDNVQGDVSIRNLRLKSDVEKQADLTVPVRELTGDIQWQQQTAGWQLVIRNMDVNINDEQWPQTDLSMIKNQNDDWTISSRYLRLSALSSLARLSAHTPEVIQQMQPAGEVRNLKLQFSAAGDVRKVAFDLTEGAALPWQDFPGVTGLSVAVRWQPQRLSLSLNSHHLTLFADPWLPRAVFFDSVTGDIHLQQQSQQWAVQTQGLRIWNDDLTLELAGHITRQPDGKIMNDLRVMLENVRISQWQQYIPQRILTDDFKAWANHAFKDGEIVSGSIEISGDLADFPYDKPDADGRFKMAFNVENVQLHFAPGWPDLRHVNATISGTGNRLEISSQQGQIAGFHFDSVTTVIDKLMDDDPVLTAQGTLTGTTIQALAFLKHSPLKARFYTAVASIKAEGNSQIALKLTVPLARSAQTEASGRIHFDDSTLFYRSQPDIRLEHIKGDLLFSGQGVEARHIKAVLFDNAVDINVKPGKQGTLVSLFGDLAVQKLKAHWPQQVPDFIKGQTFYQLDVTVREKKRGEFYIDTALHTDLKGIEINLPPPIGKHRQQARALYLKMQQQQARPYYQLRYGDSLHIVAMPHKARWRAAVQLGQGEARLPEQGIHIKGKLPTLDLTPWWKLTENSESPPSFPLLELVDDITVRIDELKSSAMSLTALNLIASKEQQGWKIKLQSEQAAGDIFWPLSKAQNAVLDINLERLILNFPEKHTDADKKSAQKSALWPAMKIRIADLNINQMKLGQLEASAQRTPTTWTVNHARLQSDSYHATIEKGVWAQTATGDTTTLQATMIISDLARLSTDWGYLPAMDSHDVKLNITLQWHADPLAFDVSAIKGTLAFDVGSGKFNDVEPGAAGRIFGLMSIATLPRRLALDFSDIFSKEFNFSSIKGHFNIAGGQAVTDDFILKSPSAEITMKGPIDLVRRQYNQRVKIRPNVSSTLPLAGAVAGGPVGLGVGTALLLADKLVDSLFGKNIVNVISYQYALKGSWDNPQFELVTQTEQ